jgi:hypothetical protein
MRRPLLEHWSRSHRKRVELGAARESCRDHRELASFRSSGVVCYTAVGRRTGNAIDGGHSHAYERVDSEFACRGNGDLHLRSCLGPSNFQSDPRPRLIAPSRAIGRLRDVAHAFAWRGRSSHRVRRGSSAGSAFNMVPQKRPVAILRPALRNEPISAGLPQELTAKGFGEPGLALTSRPPLALDRKQSDSIYKARAQAKAWNWIKPDSPFRSPSHPNEMSSLDGDDRTDPYASPPPFSSLLSAAVNRDPRIKLHSGNTSRKRLIGPQLFACAVVFLSQSW